MKFLNPNPKQKLNKVQEINYPRDFKRKKSEHELFTLNLRPSKTNQK
jgi:hypothetical protein